MPKHKGGSLQTFKADGSPDVTLYYGPGLTRTCPTCKVASYVRCVSVSGRLYKKTHPARMA